MMLQMLGAFAEFERSMIRERTRLGLLAARERGLLFMYSPLPKINGNLLHQIATTKGQSK